MAKQRCVAASIHMRNEAGEFISSTPIYVETEVEEVFDEDGNKIDVNPLPMLPDGFYKYLARKMREAIESGEFVPSFGEE